MLLGGLRRKRYAGAEHLPNLRPDQRAPHPATLPKQRRGITPQMVGRYPDYDVMEESHRWDDVTRELVEKRLGSSGSLRFFNAREAQTAQAFCDSVTAQDRDPRIPVVEMVDAKLADRKFDGYRYDTMPDDDTTWRKALQGLDDVACRRYSVPFAECALDVRDAICEQFSRGVLQGGVWDEMHCKRAWSVMLRHVVSEFYSHPWSWNEIGYGGPAYPRGYMRLGEGVREPFEKPEAMHEDPEREETPPRK